VAKNKQTVFGWDNEQNITNIVVDEKFMQSLLLLQNNPSNISQVVLALYNSINEANYDNSINIPPTVDEKILHNNVVQFREIIYSHYGEYASFLDDAYNALDSDTPGRKKRFLDFIKYQYQLQLGNLQREKQDKTKIEIVRENADSLIFHMINLLIAQIAINNHLTSHLSKEDLQLSVVTIVCHAFVECKILENPNI